MINSYYPVGMKKYLDDVRNKQLLELKTYKYIKLRKELYQDYMDLKMINKQSNYKYKNLVAMESLYFLNINSTYGMRFDLDESYR